MSPEKRKKLRERRKSAELDAIRAWVFNQNTGVPDMSRADGAVLFKEIDRLTAENDRLRAQVERLKGGKGES